MKSPGTPANPEQSTAALQIVDTPRFRTILIAAIVGLVLALYFFADRLALRAEQDALHRLAKSHADLIISFRNFYSGRLLPIVRQHSELSITHDYKDKQGALPIPATMTLDLVDEIARSNPEMNLRLVSPYPFPWRKISLDAFETEALATLQASGNSEFMRLEDSARGKLLRYAAPIRLEKSCVDCHNSHPSSPKRDWKEADVRGIQVMTLSLAGLSFDKHPQHFIFATVLLLAFGIAGGTLVWLHGRNVRAVRTAQANAAGMLDRQRALDAHAIVSITDRTGKILYANEKFCAIAGYAESELIGQNHRMLKSGAHPNSFYSQMWVTISAGHVWEGEICNKAKNGSLYWVKSTIVPFLDETGCPNQYIAIRTDISERKAFEDELIAKRIEAEAASRAKGDFLANMSHEIRTPMNGIIGMTNLALDTDREDERQEYLKIVKNSAESLVGIIDDILDFSKIEADKLVLEQVEFDLHQAVSEILKTLGPRAHQKGLELICDFADDVPRHVLGDPTRIRQVLINLVGNAIKFTSGGEIVVIIALEARTQSSATLQIAVRDTGIGIASGKLDSIFEAFSQADASTTRKYGGTGLGLSISSRLVSLMGAHMSVDSDLGKGSTFQFTLVLGLGKRPFVPPSTVNLTGKRALVVDDKAVNRDVLQRHLTRWGMQAVCAGSGQEAQVLCADPTWLPDLVLIDRHMPEMDGLALATWIRAQPHLKSTPLLMLSSSPVKDDAEQVQALRMHSYLIKPVSDVDLLKGVKLSLEIEGDADEPIHAADPSHTANPSGLDVLLVEDNRVNQLLATRLLEKWGHKVTLAVNGQEAVDRLCRGERYDIVLMDMQMPVMGGIEATRMIRAHEHEHGQPRAWITAMTANAMQGDREACIEAGMDDYLSKPINKLELESKLSKLAAHPESS